jgi:hypothetical protein
MIANTPINSLSIFEKITLRIIKEQESVIGPLAWDEARKVQGLHIIDQKTGAVAVDKEEKETVDRLVSQYDRLFGQASREVSRAAVHSLVADLLPEEVPSTLR